jgi:hypothetical protein
MTIRDGMIRPSRMDNNTDFFDRKADRRVIGLRLMRRRLSF